MCNDSTTFIQQEIQQYKKNCVAQRQLEMQLCQDSSLERTALTQRLLELKVRTQRVRSWMLVLNEDEEFVICRHPVSYTHLQAERRRQAAGTDAHKQGQANRLTNQERAPCHPGAKQSGPHAAQGRG